MTATIAATISANSAAPGLRTMSGATTAGISHMPLMMYSHGSPSGRSHCQTYAFQA
jgi:hypothetical protein